MVETIRRSYSSKYIICEITGRVLAMDIKRKYIQLFLDLNKSEKGLLGFTLSNRYNLSVTDVISFMIEYQKKGYITCDNEYRIKITADGIAAIATLYERGITSEYYKGSDYFDEVSSKNSIAINEPYLPKMDFLNHGKSKKNKGGENEGN